MTNIADLYNDPPLIHPWELIDGQPQCVRDGVPVAAPEATATLQRNAAVRIMVAAVEAFEEAQRVVARGEPDNGQPRQIPDPAAVRPEDAPDDWTAPLIPNPEWALLPRTIETTGQDGETQTAPEPRWQAYDDAQAELATATDLTKALARWRVAEAGHGSPEESVAEDDVEAEGAPWEADRDAVLAALETEAAKPLAHDPRWPSFSADAVKAECGRRIYGVASDSAQKNMLANAVAGRMSTADKAIFRAGVDWIAAMQTVCRELIVAQDVSFAADEHWPPVPDGVADLAAKF